MTNRPTSPAFSNQPGLSQPSADLQSALQQRLRERLGSPVPAGFPVQTSGQDHGYPQDWDRAAPRIFDE